MGAIKDARDSLDATSVISQEYRAVLLGFVAQAFEEGYERGRKLSQDPVDLDRGLGESERADVPPA